MRNGHQRAKDVTNSIGWDIQEYPVHSNGVIHGNYKAIHRDDNNKLLNIVKRQYTPATNKMFVEVVEKLSSITGFPVHGYTEFGNGERLIGYLKSENTKVAGFENSNYMIVGNSFDYSTGFFTGLTNIVLRCENQFSQITKQKSVRHNSMLAERIEEMYIHYQNFTHQEKILKTKFERWHGITIDADLKEMFVNNILNITDRMIKDDEVSTVKLNQKKSLFAAINRETNEMGNNLYGMFNGVTYYTTHEKGSKNKIFGNVFGHLADINNRAFAFAEDLDYKMNA